jgi:hypothetical protein
VRKRRGKRVEKERRETNKRKIRSRLAFAGSRVTVPIR